jgi:hypothetical protein
MRQDGAHFPSVNAESVTEISRRGQRNPVRSVRVAENMTGMDQSECVTIRRGEEALVVVGCTV